MPTTILLTSLGLTKRSNINRNLFYYYKCIFCYCILLYVTIVRIISVWGESGNEAGSIHHPVLIFIVDCGFPSYALLNLNLSQRLFIIMRIGNDWKFGEALGCNISHVCASVCIVLDVLGAVRVSVCACVRPQCDCVCFFGCFCVCCIGCCICRFGV